MGVLMSSEMDVILEFMRSHGWIVQVHKGQANDFYTVASGRGKLLLRLKLENGWLIIGDAIFAANNHRFRGLLADPNFFNKFREYLDA
jgi:hypothetical protein